MPLIGSCCATIVQPKIDGFFRPRTQLNLALERMSETQLDVLPVVSRANIHELEGILTLQDVLDSYGFNSSARST